MRGGGQPAGPELLHTNTQPSLPQNTADEHKTPELQKKTFVSRHESSVGILFYSRKTEMSAENLKNVKQDFR